MFEDKIVYLNGEFIKWNQAKVHIMSHSMGRGSAIFEVISVHKTDKGTSVFRLDEHINRLFKTASMLDMKIQNSKEELIESVLRTVAANKISYGIVKIICFYPQISFEILPPQKTLDVSIFAIDTSDIPGRTEDSAKKNVTLCVSMWKKLDPQSVPVEAKVAANYLNGMLAREEAKKRGFTYALLLDKNGFVAEGGTESVFIVKEDQLMTPAPGTILKSITRKSIIQLAKNIGISVVEKELNPDLLYTADEIFLSCSPLKVLSVSRVGERSLYKIPGPVTVKINSALENITSGKDLNYSDWLFSAKF